VKDLASLLVPRLRTRRRMIVFEVLREEMAAREADELTTRQRYFRDRRRMRAALNEICACASSKAKA